MTFSSILPMNVFEPWKDDGWHDRMVDRWEIVTRVGWAFIVNCPHGWSPQPLDLQPTEALTAHMAICKDCP
jgi:hypothetical protein